MTTGNQGRMRTASRHALDKDRPNGATDYARYSTLSQGSIPEQQAINAELAAEEGLVILASFADEAMSRSIADRKDVLAMFTYIEAHLDTVGSIIVPEWERLTGDLEQHGPIVQFIKNHRIFIITEDMDPVDPWDEEAMQKLGQRALDAKTETLKVSRRTKRGLRAKVKAGTVAMCPAYGVRAKPMIGPDGTMLESGARYLDERKRVIRSGEIEVHPEEIVWLRQIFEWADKGMGYEDIARKLTAAKVPTKRGKNGWRATVISQLLENPLYKGEMTWGFQRVLRINNKNVREFRSEGEHGRIDKPSPLGPLVDVEMWERINDRIRRRRENRERTMVVRKTANNAVLHNMVYCARCGHKMYARNDHGGPDKQHLTPLMRFRCQSGRQGNEIVRDGFDGVCVQPMSMSEKKILEALSTLNKTDETCRATVRAKRRDITDVIGQRKAVEKEIETTNGKIKAAQRLNLNGLMTESQLAEFIAEYNVDLADAERRLGRIAVQRNPALIPERAIGINFATLAAALGDKDRPVEVRRALLRDAGIERIFVNDPVVEIEFLDLDASI